MEADADARAYEALSKHPLLRDLTSITHELMASAAEARRVAPSAERVEVAVGARKLTRDDVGTAFGNALDVLSRGPEDDAERSLARALAAHAVAANRPGGAEDEARLAGELLWLAAHTPFDALGLLDVALGDGADGLWTAITDRVRRVDAGTLPAVGRCEALVGAVALGASSSRTARERAARLASDVHDAGLARLLALRPGGGAAASLDGQVVPSPRGPAATFALAITGLLLAANAARLVARVVLGYASPATASLTEDGGVRVKWRTVLLGRTLRDREIVIPRTGLARATREVRYPSLAMYAGLLALAAGSYLGVTTFVDGVRSASPSLLAWGLGLVALGLALDFILTSLAPGARGRCRVLFTARDGARVCVGGVDAGAATALLARLTRP